MPVPRAIFKQIQALIPPLDGSLHKGQSGRVGVLGGAQDYTGAPFFAAISALKFGADLSHVICSPVAAGAIKSYSPDLIVHPILQKDSTIDSVQQELQSILSRLHVLIVGPGLGRESYMQEFAKLAVNTARDRGMYLVFDADALFMVGKELSIIQGYRRAVITPNVVEFKRLSEQVGVNPDVPANKRAAAVSRKLGGVTVLQKGANDLIAVDTTGEKMGNTHEADKRATEIIEVDIRGGMKRCGGQGDVLSGCVGTFLAWGKCYEDGAFGDGEIPASQVPLLGAIGGSMVTRTASRRAFAKEGRGVVTEDMLSEIGKSFAEIFGEDPQGQDHGRL